MSSPVGNILETLTKMRERAKQGIARHAILREASVLTHFDLFELSEHHADGEEAMLLLMDSAVPLTKPENTWGLPLADRQTLLARFDDRAEVQACLKTLENRPNNRLQTALELLMTSPDAVAGLLAQGQDTAQIADILDALSWIEKAPQLQTGLPDADTVRQALLDARRQAPLRRLVGDNFQGREEVLAKMQAYLDDPAMQDVLILHGPDGIGKSTVLAKFALDAAERKDVDTVIYLNLDRPILRPEEPLSLLLDLVTQLTQQFTENADMLQMAGHEVRSLEQKLSYSRENESLLESAASDGDDWDMVISVVALAISDLPGDRSILVLVDTFEQVQRHGNRVVSKLWRMTHALMHVAPRLRIIAAGRLEEQQFTDNRVALDVFERSDVARVLSKASKTPLSDQLIDDIYTLTDGHPLTVQLAASFVGRAGPDAFDDPEFRQQYLSQLEEEKRDALL
ncbi:MAG: AAA family ATPase [Roseibium sp.]